MDEALKLDDLHEEVVVSFDTEGNPYSYYSSDKWVLWSIDFTASFTMLSGDFKSSAKKIVFQVINNVDLKSKKSTIENLLSGASVLEHCIKACGGDNYGFINNDRNYRLFLQEAKNRKLKYKTWKNHLIFVTHAQKEGFIKRSIDNFEKLSIYLAPNGDAVSQAVCLPEKIAAFYYKEALEFVEKYHPYRHVISESYSEFTSEYKSIIESNRYSCNRTRRKHALKAITHDIPNLGVGFDYVGNWLSMLRGACYIVIAAFTGCRDGEIKSFNIDSYQEKKYAGFTVSILSGFHTKPNVGGMKRQTSWVTIPSVKKAIELLWDTFNFARKDWKNHAKKIVHVDERNKVIEDADSLFITLPYRPGYKVRAGKQSISHSLSKFLRSLGNPPEN